MRSKEDGLEYYLRVINGEPNYFTVFGRPLWMNDEQWRQALSFARGLQIPTDGEIVDGLRNCIEYRGSNRARLWGYQSVPAFLVGRQNYDWWCGFISEYGQDPDLQVDEGL